MNNPGLESSGRGQLRLFADFLVGGRKSAGPMGALHPVLRNREGIIVLPLARLIALPQHGELGRVDPGRPFRPFRFRLQPQVSRCRARWPAHHGIRCPGSDPTDESVERKHQSAMRSGHRLRFDDGQA
jgi:hypothetical protein